MRIRGPVEVRPKLRDPAIQAERLPCAIVPQPADDRRERRVARSPNHLEKLCGNEEDRPAKPGLIERTSERPRRAYCGL